MLLRCRERRRRRSRPSSACGSNVEQLCLPAGRRASRSVVGFTAGASRATRRARPSSAPTRPSTTPKAHGRNQVHDHADAGRAAMLADAVEGRRLDVRRPQRVRLDELAPRLDLVAHQHREHLVRLDRVVDLHAQQAAHGRVHRGFPQLLGVHLAQALVALARDARARPRRSASASPGGSRRPSLPWRLSPSPRRTTAPSPQQAAEGVGGVGQRGVVGAVHEVRVITLLLMLPWWRRLMRSIGLSVRASNSPATSADARRRRARAAWPAAPRPRLRRRPRCPGPAPRRRRWRAAPRRPCSAPGASITRFGQLVLARQFGQRFAGDRAACRRAGQRRSRPSARPCSMKASSSRPSFRYRSSLPAFTLYSGGCAM